MKESLQNTNQLYFDMVVYHSEVYNGNEPLTVVGIKKHHVQLKGDYSGIGVDNSSCWLPLDGVLIDKKINKMEEKISTLGEQRVRISFNPSKESVVDRIKQKSAELIDILQTVRNDEVSKTYGKSPAQLQALSGEKIRLISLAQTAYEEAAMWAVKAATI